MALIGSIAISMKVNTAQLARGLNQARGLLNQFGNQVSHSLALGFAGAGALGGIYKLVSAGSDLVESQNMIKQVFGESSTKVIEASNQMNAAFGVSKVEFQDTVAVTGAMAKNLGYTADNAADVGIRIAKLTGDLASQKNLRYDEALVKITGGLAGESEGLKRVGVFLNETLVKQEAYKTGIAKVNSELTETQKFQARLSSLIKQTADANGDLTRTADDVANATRGVQGRFESLAEVIGTQLQPIAKTVLGEISLSIAAAQLAWVDYQNQTIAAGMTTVQGAEVQVQSIGFLQNAIGFVADMWQTVQLGFSLVQSYVTQGIRQIVELLAELGKAVDAIGMAFGKDFGVHDMLKIVAEDLNRLSHDQFAKFQKDLAKPPSSEGINAYFDKAKDKISEIRAELLKSQVDVTKFKPTEIGVKNKEIKFSEAMAFGSSEAANTILRTRSGTQGKGVEAVVKNTGDANLLLREIVKNTAVGAGQGLLMGALGA